MLFENPLESVRKLFLIFFFLEHLEGYWGMTPDNVEGIKVGKRVWFFLVNVNCTTLDIDTVKVQGRVIILHLANILLLAGSIFAGE